MSKLAKPAMPNLLPLPQEIIIDILSRLPVKSLLQYKSVSKLWYSLISNPDFVKAHLKRLIQDNNIYQHKLIISGCPFLSVDPEAASDQDEDIFMTQLSFPSRWEGIYADFNILTTELSFPIRNPEYELGLVGSCNGLICAIIDSKHFVVLNPSTRQAKELPEYSIYEEDMIFNGFGYDSQHDDYKIMIGSNNKLEIFTLRSNTWRSIQGLSYSIELYGPGAFLNGVLHWLLGQLIVRFDLADEEFLAKVKLPNQMDNQALYPLNILGSCLCVSTAYDAPKFEVWILKEYGDWDSWTRLFSFAIDPLPECEYWFKFLWVTKSGQILFVQDGWSIFLFDPKEVTLKKVWIPNHWDWCDPIMYIESLVSPHMSERLIITGN